MELIKNQLYTSIVDAYSSEGFGVCRIGGRAVFVPRTLVGEKWQIRIVKVTSSAVYARGESLIEASPARRESLCPFFGRCGGCDLWHMSYEEELRFKLARVNDALRHIGRQSLQAEEILGSETAVRYRNKGIFAVGERQGLPVCGFFRERSHEIIPVSSCLIQNELSERSAAAVVQWMTAHAIPAYDEATGQGAIRHVFCRTALHSPEAVVCVVTAAGLGANTSSLVEALRLACPELSGIVLNVNKSRGNTVLAGDFYTLWGDAILHDTLCGFRFSIAPQAFFQINPPQAERLYARAVEYAALKPDELALDLYCGAGTISLCLAKNAGRVIGAEIVSEAVENARLNAAENGVGNAEFICGDAGEAAEALFRRGLRPQAVVVDPPRKGLAETAVEAVISLSPERVVYVSCNCATLARDVLRFQDRGYSLRAATAVDMFPRTCHVEAVVLMTRIGTGNG
ncbi:MAG: 23S rRNA (uracil(1939)-C(5))-methyltransferase RlmD [Oscillospiraceae bacterium]|nr:23S rRNA (uracil(1939)-C(5))-methyltransferase RlmD [Oscillospiraceae bacterium]